MRLSITLLMLTICPLIFAQDGSDINYIKPENLDDSHIEKTCHIDFGSRSFRGQTLDTLELEVKGKLIKFVERRVDNGYNNWFKEQYLEAITPGKNPIIRLKYAKIDSLSSEKIHVTSILGYYRDGLPLDSITLIHHYYLRKNIAEILIKH
ncbi:hypothetical protein [Spongiimicrobium sp. 2-473A-2-J]|uniref:hypothetical protein n=1 Tax=Eudoraea algarum TaxID=3417568 RepID=UPI003D35D23A